MAVVFNKIIVSLCFKCEEVGISLAKLHIKINVLHVFDSSSAFYSCGNKTFNSIFTNIYNIFIITGIACVTDNEKL